MTELNTQSAEEVAPLRHRAMLLGPGDPAAWGLLEQAVRLERETDGRGQGAVTAWPWLRPASWTCWRCLLTVLTALASPRCARVRRPSTVMTERVMASPTLDELAADPAIAASLSEAARQARAAEIVRTLSAHVDALPESQQAPVSRALVKSFAPGTER